ncbi:MAG TPA: SdrD B-like domain-containing protein [Kiritimatiellia bacterium]|nr:SdrD B-like domain-containing protein [Kiritimatiellia bacterium]
MGGIIHLSILGRWQLPVIAVICLANLSSVSASTISGRVWHDLNCNGIQDEGEPGLSNVEVGARSVPYSHTLSVSATTDVNGVYTLTPPSNGIYHVYVSIPPQYRPTVNGAGDDETLDSDLLPNTRTDDLLFIGIPITHVDAGLCLRVASVSLETSIVGASPGHPFYVTNGTWVTFKTSVSNDGEMILSNIFVYDEVADGIIGFIECPNLLNPSHPGYVAFTNQRAVFSSETNLIEVIADSVSLFCENMDIDPVIYSVQTVIIVLSDTLDEDDDGFTEWQEYLADTDPADPQSFFPPASGDVQEDGFVEIHISATSTQRLYGVFHSTDLVEHVESWELITPPQAGTGEGLSFILTNPSPNALLRTGVWPP